MAEPTDDLDELLDSALDDFGKIDLGASLNSNGDRDTEKTSSSSLVPASQVRGLGLGLPDLKSKKKGKQKTVEDSHVTEALDKLTQQTREVVKRFESAVPPIPQADLLKDGMEDFIKQFQDLAGSQDMDSIVETMMQQLLSKEILHEPMKEIGERYPKWLEEHKAELKQEEYERYCHQYELIKQLNEVYENDPSNFPQIFDLMQRMQECGQPPNDIVQELAPDFDLTNFGNPLSQEMTNSSAECCIMSAECRCKGTHLYSGLFNVNVMDSSCSINNDCLEDRNYRWQNTSIGLSERVYETNPKTNIVYWFLIVLLDSISCHDD